MTTRQEIGLVFASAKNSVLAPLASEVHCIHKQVISIAYTKSPACEASAGLTRIKRCGGARSRRQSRFPANSNSTRVAKLSRRFTG